MGNPIASMGIHIIRTHIIGLSLVFLCIVTMLQEHITFELSGGTSPGGCELRPLERVVIWFVY